MKKIFIVLGILFIAVGLFACQDEVTTYTFEEILASIEIEYASNNDIDFVTENIGLPVVSSLDAQATISWLSLSENIISNTGVVNRQAEDTQVTLILSLRVGSVSKQILYEIVVKGTNVYYKVVYDIDGDLTETDVLQGTTLAEPEAPSKDNHVFMGWFVGENQYTFTDSVESNLTITARFDEILVANYTLQIYLENLVDNSYVLVSTEVLSGNIGDTVSFNEFREGFFINLDSSKLSGVISEETPLLIRAYYDRVHYEVSYLVNDIVIETQTYKHGQLVNSISDPIILNYTFNGWFNGDSRYLFDTPIEEDLVLVARFDEILVANYTIEVYLENLNDDLYTMSSSQIYSGNVGQTINYNQTRRGFIVNQELSTVSGTINNETPLVIKVYYERLRYDVKYIFRETTLETLTFKHGQQITTIEAPTITNFTFVGWFMDETFDTPFNAFANVTSNLNVYAKYNEITTGQYIINIYFENLGNDEYELTSSITQTAQMGTFVEVNIESFNGFILNNALSVTSATVLQNDVILLDVFYDRIVYTVSFISDSVVVDTFEVKHGAVVIQIEDPEKLDHTFLGWTRTVNGTEAYNFNSLVTANVTLYAMWRNDNLPTYTGYYTTLSGLTDSQVKSELTNIITPMTDRGYTFAITILQNSDRDPNNSSNLILIYSRLSRPSIWSGGAIGTWNREHVWPQSKLGTASVSDVHNLKPADPQQNSTRSNYPFVQGTGSAALVTNSSGGVIGYWPGAADKGDIARILLYMNVRWGLSINSSSVGDLNLLLRWHLEDPVDDFERNRNDVIYTYQVNRNPFIDHPGLVERIWGPITLSSGDTVNLGTSSNEYNEDKEFSINTDDLFSYKENQAYFMS